MRVSRHCQHPLTLIWINDTTLSYPREARILKVKKNIENATPANTASLSSPNMVVSENQVSTIASAIDAKNAIIYFFLSLIVVDLQR